MKIINEISLDKVFSGFYTFLGWLFVLIIPGCLAFWVALVGESLFWSNLRLLLLINAGGVITYWFFAVVVFACRGKSYFYHLFEVTRMRGALFLPAIFILFSLFLYTFFTAVFSCSLYFLDPTNWKHFRIGSGYDGDLYRW
jgi:hypothetical protein